MTSTQVTGESHYVSPATYLVAAVLVSAVLLVASTWYKISMPWLGLETSPGDLGAQVERVNPALLTNPNLLPGVELVGVLGASQQHVQLTPLMFAGEPDTLVSTIAEYQEFIAQQDKLFSLLAGDELVFIDTESNEYKVPVLNGRPLISLGFDYWFQWFCGIASLIISVGVFAWRQSDVAAIGFLSMGVGLFLSASSAAMYSTREFGMLGQLLTVLAPVNQLGVGIYSGGFIVTMLRYPKALVGRLVSWIILGCFFGWSLLFSVAQLAPDMSSDLAYRVPVVVALLTALSAAGVQWHLAKAEPVSRASLLWFCAALLLGGFAWGIMQLLPHFLGVGDVTETQGMAFGLLLSVNVGIALGVVRYRLFDLGGWWLSAFSVAIGGAGVLLADVLLVYVLQLNQALSLSLALAFVGWAYFPFRQWIWRRFTAAEQGDVSQMWLDQILSMESGDKLADFQLLILKALSPANLELVDSSLETDETEIVNHGETLLIPIGGRILKVSGLSSGKRLATRDDVKLCDQLRRLHKQVSDYRQGIDAGTKRERERISSDLHDDVGARLIRIRGGANSAQQQAITDVLTELRQLSHSLGKQHQTVDEVVADILFEISEQCEIEGVDLDWQADLPEFDMPTLDISLCLDWVRIMRELTTNALRYSDPSRISVKSVISPREVHVNFQHDSAQPLSSPSDWTHGMGLNNLSKRVARHSGEIHWRLEKNTGMLCTTFSLSLAPKLSG